MLTYYLLAISEYCQSHSLICTQCLQMIVPYKKGWCHLQTWKLWLSVGSLEGR